MALVFVVVFKRKQSRSGFKKKKDYVLIVYILFYLGGGSVKTYTAFNNIEYLVLKV